MSTTWYLESFFMLVSVICLGLYASTIFDSYPDHTFASFGSIVFMFGMLVYKLEERRREAFYYRKIAEDKSAMFESTLQMLPDPILICEKE